jgi:hypothetical protein
MAKSKDSDESREELKDRLRQGSVQEKSDWILPLPDRNDLIEQEKWPLERLLSRIDEKVEDEEKRPKMRREAVRFYVEGKKSALDDWYEKYEEELRFREPWGPLKWMTNDPAIKHMLNTTKFGDVYRLLWKSTMPRKKTLLLMERYGVPYIKEINKKKGVVEERVPVLLEELDLGRMNRELRFSARSHTVYKYVRQFCRAGILREVGKRGERGRRIYAMGAWVPFSIDSFRRKPFLKDTPEMRKALRKIRVRE